MKQIALITGAAGGIGKEPTETQATKGGNITAGGFKPEGLGKLYKNN